MLHLTNYLAPSLKIFNRSVLLPVLINPTKKTNSPDVLSSTAFTLPGHGNAAELQRKSYIVYLGDKPDDGAIDVQSLHATLLDKAISGSNSKSAEAISDDLDGTKRIMHSYTKSFSGFAAMLTEEEAKNLDEMEEVTSVFPNRRRRLHTTRSWSYMGYMGFPPTEPRAPLESDVIQEPRRRRLRPAVKQVEGRLPVQQQLHMQQVE